MIENKAPRYTWAEVRQHAQTRPTMYIGDQAIAHRTAIVECLRLLWQAKVFRRPQSVTVDLSPTQYILRAKCGPLIRSIQQNFRFGTGQTLGSPWCADNHTYSEKLDLYEKEHDIPYSRKRWNSGWRYCFCGPLGPRLDAPACPAVLAHSFVWGLRINQGMWCEIWADGIPIDKPFFIERPSSFGLLVAARLDSTVFSSLPFTEEDVHWFTGLSHHHYWSHPKHEPRRYWTPGEIIAHWHPQDDLISDKLLTADELRELL